MKAGTIYLISAIVAGLFGLAFLLVPEQLMDLYDVTLSGPTSYLGRLFGGSLIGFAVAFWFARGATDSPAGRAITLSAFVADALGFILALLGQLAGEFNALGWSTVVVYGLLALAFGYIYFIKPAA